VIVIGLTGGIASGKSTTATLFRDRGIPIHDADAVVHRLLAPNGLGVPAVEKQFGKSILSEDGGVDRQKLGKLVFADQGKRKALEQILHPLVKADRDAFLNENRKAQTPVVVLDVPLLFETGGTDICDYIIVVAVDPETQAARAMARPGMTRQKFEGILKSQWPMSRKISSADFVLDTGHGIDAARRDLHGWLDQLPDMQN